MPRRLATSGSRSDRRRIGRRVIATRSRRPGSTCHAVAAAHERRVEVVERRRGHERLRQATDAAHEVARRCGSSSLNTSSRSSSGGSPVGTASSRSSWASLQARIAVRCWPRDANPDRSRPSRSNARSSRCGPTSVAPFQTSFSAVSAKPSPERVLGRLARRRRRVGDGAHGQPSLAGCDLRVGVGERRGERGERLGAPAQDAAALGRPATPSQ